MQKESDAELFFVHGVELQPHLRGDLAVGAFPSIEQDAVVEDQIHVSIEIDLGVIGVIGQLGADGGEVHGVLDDVGIVGDVEGHWVNRVQEDAPF